MKESQDQHIINDEQDTSIDLIRLLIVEDEPNQIQQIVDSIEDFNEKREAIKIEYNSINTFHEAIQHLIGDNYDAAIIDLKLSNEKIENEGLELVKLIKKNLRYPVYVRTGYPEKISGVEEIQNHPFIKIYDKTHIIDNIIEEIYSLHSTGLIRTIGTKGKIDRYLNEIFWSNLSKVIQDWDDDLLNEDNQEKSLVRYCISLLHEHLELSEIEGEYEVYHPFEVYIKPPIKLKYYFGDILFSENNFYIILSPPCDMAQEKFDKVILAEIEDLNSIVDFNNFLQKYQETKSQSKKKAITKYITNNFNNKYHFIPPFQEFNGGLINFQKIISKTNDELNDYNRFATISEKFAKDISSRFAQYFSRQGQPDLNIDILLKNLLTES